MKKWCVSLPVLFDRIHFALYMNVVNEQNFINRMLKIQLNVKRYLNAQAHTAL
jgi:hypothetical protein